MIGIVLLLESQQEDANSDLVEVDRYLFVQKNNGVDSRVEVEPLAGLYTQT